MVEKNVLIEYDRNCEMMSITSKNGKVIFYGNYWDFDREPESLKRFIEKLGLKVDMKETELEE